MPAAEIALAAIQITRLAMNAIEAAQAGNEDEARQYLAQVQERVAAADQAWQDAG